MNIRIERTDSSNPHFQALVTLLDVDMRRRDGEDADFFAQFNKTDSIRHTVVAYAGEQPVGCGAFKEYTGELAEIKRMFVKEEFRRRGIASKILEELERWAGETGYAGCILETGKAMPEAIALYLRSGYDLIPNYGQYETVESSVCLKKNLIQGS